ncbi:alkaline phosphatase family protein [Pontixanthobacter aestiaquae]|uniref:Phosphoesterase n=1 Tax=Pontixanthobacter aestiaquae TaxID=1509367 RepID=A0A844ZAK3_9SPHN|nr:alkaline phosphatase family protein [Pontixanthobacter aestiaquae]MDN3644659.1 alkaline phosphatase family protein [Pontixanthobacter aestiaquae]MXO84332.1 phosphoesterase [Pontixanthobacter aestiaquae]
MADSNSPIEHVFVLMLENRSFDHLFALSGIPGITAAKPNDPEFSNELNGDTYYFTGNAPEQMPTDPLHGFDAVVEQLTTTGKFIYKQPYPERNNGGFAASYATTSTRENPLTKEQINWVMAGAVPSQIPATIELAKSFTLCDHWYSSLPGPTWPNRFFLHGASSMGFDFSPTPKELLEWEDPFGGIQYSNGSVFDAMGHGNWRIYQDRRGPISGQIPNVGALKGLSLFDVHNLKHLEHDLRKGYDKKYTFIEPAYGNILDNSYEGGTSQHPMDSLAGGDALVAEVYNAIRNSPVWEKSLLLITYDEHGGFYDSQPPVPMPAPGDYDPANPPYGGNGFDFTLSGVRVPAIIVSPWAAKGAVDNTIYDHSSVAATLTELFGMKTLTDRDKAANNLTPQLTDTCRTDCPQNIQGAAMPSAVTEAEKPLSEHKSKQVLADRGKLGGAVHAIEKTLRDRGLKRNHQAQNIPKNGVFTMAEADAYLRKNMELIDQERANHDA